LAIWLSGNALASINVVALRQTQFLVLGWVIICGRVNHLGMLPANYANSAFHPYGVDKLSTNLPGWGEGKTITSVGWQITLCDPTDKWRPVVLR